MKATKQYFNVVLSVYLNELVISLEPLDDMLKCDHSNESYVDGTFLWCSLLF